MEEMEEEEPEKFANHFSKAVAEEVSGGDLEEIYKKVPGDGGGGRGGSLPACVNHACLAAL